MVYFLGGTTGARISMDGRGSWRDHVFIERLWKILKYDQLTCMPINR